MQNNTSIPISNPPPRPAIPIAEGADQAVKKKSTEVLLHITRNTYMVIAVQKC